MATPAYRSRAAFVEHGLKKHALTEKDDRKCAICFDPYTAEIPADVKEPMTASTEDADHTLVKEPTTDSTEDADHTPVIITGCGHIYGSVCLHTWLKKGNSCPMCRKELFPRPWTLTSLPFPTGLTTMEEELMISEGPNLNPRTRGGRRARDATRTREVQYMLHQSRRELEETVTNPDPASQRAHLGADLSEMRTRLDQARNRLIVAMRAERQERAEGIPPADRTQQFEIDAALDELVDITYNQTDNTQHTPVSTGRRGVSALSTDDSDFRPSRRGGISYGWIPEPWFSDEDDTDMASDGAQQDYLLDPTNGPGWTARTQPLPVSTGRREGFSLSAHDSDPTPAMSSSIAYGWIPERANEDNTDVASDRAQRGSVAGEHNSIDDGATIRYASSGEESSIQSVDLQDSFAAFVVTHHRNRNRNRNRGPYSNVAQDGSNDGTNNDDEEWPPL